MAGDDRYFIDPDQTSEGENEYNGADEPANEQPDSPASVVFMQMMRQAAAESEVTAAREAEPATLNPPQVYENENERHHAAKLEAERLKRVKRKRERRRRHTVGVLAGFVRSILVVLISGATIATILSMWTKPEALDISVRQQMARSNATEVPVLVPTLTAIPNIQRRIGIISGHYGKPPEHFQTDFDPGAICDDGLTENGINYAVASRVVAKLRDRGYTVDLLEEFDPRLPEYDADVLVSLHSNDCQDYGEPVSGFLVSQAQARAVGGADEKLVNCLALHYGQITGLDRRFGLTRDMTDYHVFGDIKPSTPGAILEMGFMRDDRLLLTEQQELLANAVTSGIVCYLDPSTGLLGPTPIPSPTPTQPTSTPGIAPIMTSPPTSTPMPTETAVPDA